jgi:hypothetical protein
MRIADGGLGSELPGVFVGPAFLVGDAMRRVFPFVLLRCDEPSTFRPCPAVESPNLGRLLLVPPMADPGRTAGVTTPLPVPTSYEFEPGT